jgi:hypothetical protein
MPSPCHILITTTRYLCNCSGTPKKESRDKTLERRNELKVVERPVKLAVALGLRSSCIEANYQEVKN